MGWDKFDFVATTYQFRVKELIKTRKWKNTRRIMKGDLGAWINSRQNKHAYFCTIQSFENPVRTQGESHWADFYIDMDAEPLDDTQEALDEALEKTLGEARLIIDCYI